MKKNLSLNIFLFFISIIIIYFSYSQSLTQNWSSIIDFDLTVIFNSLQVISGYEQDFREHPGFTQFLIYGIFYKFFSFFDQNLIINVDQLLELQNPTDNLQKLFLISRFANSIFFVFILFFFVRICEIFEIKNELIIISLIGIILSSTSISNLFILRADIIAIAFILAAFYLLLSFVKFEKSNIKLFLSGAFILLGLLAKIQAIVILVPILCFVFIFINNELKFEEFNLSMTKYLNYYIIFYIFFLIIYLVLQFFIYQHPRFSDQNYIDVIIFIIFNSLLLFSFFLAYKKNNQLFKIIFSVFILIFIGFFFTLIFFLILSYLDVFKLSPYILLRLTNPFYYLKVYSPISEANVDISFISNFLTIILQGIKVQIYGLIILCLLLIFSIRRDLLQKNYKNFQYKIVFFVSIILIILSFNFRYYKLYDLYYLPFYYFLITYCLSSLRKYYIILFLVGVILVNNNFFFNIYESTTNRFNKVSNIEKICFDKNTRKFIWWWARKLDDKFFKKICVEQGYKFKN
tara:strand:- start:497 stop:2050 length:1554 start_codon:yes stop_codon:yes gene_type:complete